MFEYMAAGKPIVSSDLPVLREVLEDERNSLLVPPLDLAGWARAIRRLEADPGLRDRLGSTARADQIARYTWDQRAASVLADLPRTTA
jgi:glycosyltransferase involved in cell wall biosynthesis